MNRYGKKQNYFMEVAKLTSTLSTCKSLQVGAVVVNEGHVIASGFNGVPAGLKHCVDVNPDDHKEFADNYEIHAEMNALFDALDRGQQVRGATVFCTHSPCRNCYKHMRRAGIQYVYYNERYHRMSDLEIIQMSETMNSSPLLIKFHKDED